MNNTLRCFVLSACVALSGAAIADTCSDLYSRSESDFLRLTATNPTGVANTLTQCVSQQVCKNSIDPATCTSNLYYYHSLATYYMYAGAPPANAIPVTNPTPVTTDPAVSTSTTTTPATPVAIVPSSTTNTDSSSTSSGSTSSTSTSSGSNDIYQNIQF